MVSTRTVVKAYRIEPDAYARAQQRAQAEGVDVASKVADFVRRYGRGKPVTKPKE